MELDRRAVLKGGATAGVASAATAPILFGSSEFLELASRRLGVKAQLLDDAVGRFDLGLRARGVPLLATSAAGEAIALDGARRRYHVASDDCAVLLAPNRFVLATALAATYAAARKPARFTVTAGCAFGGLVMALLEGPGDAAGLIARGSRAPHLGSVIRLSGAVT